MMRCASRGLEMEMGIKESVDSLKVDHRCSFISLTVSSCLTYYLDFP